MPRRARSVAIRRGRGTHGQQPVWPRILWAPQHTPGDVCEKARLQSFSKQQLLQPCDASERRDSGTDTSLSADARPKSVATRKVAAMLPESKFGSRHKVLQSPVRCVPTCMAGPTLRVTTLAVGEHT